MKTPVKTPVKTSPPEGGQDAGAEGIARAALASALKAKPAPTGPRPKKVPIRTCVACRTERPKRDLVRIVRMTDGRVAMDPSGRLNGRGGYLCPRADCLKLALKRRALERALGGSLPEEDVAALETAMANVGDGGPPAP